MESAETRPDDVINANVEREESATQPTCDSHLHSPQSERNTDDVIINESDYDAETDDEGGEYTMDDITGTISDDDVTDELPSTPEQLPVVDVVCESQAKDQSQADASTANIDTEPGSEAALEHNVGAASDNREPTSCGDSDRDQPNESTPTNQCDTQVSLPSTEVTSSRSDEHANQSEAQATSENAQTVTPAAPEVVCEDSARDSAIDAESVIEPSSTDQQFNKDDASSSNSDAGMTSAAADGSHDESHKINVGTAAGVETVDTSNAADEHKSQHSESSPVEPSVDEVQTVAADAQSMSVIT